MLSTLLSMVFAAAALMLPPAARGALTPVPGDDSTMILINFGRSNYKIGGTPVPAGIVKANGPMFNNAAKTLAVSSDWMHDSGKKYGYNHDTDHPKYGWSGGVDLNPDVDFDPQASTRDTDWRYECAVKFPKSKKFEVQVEKGVYQVEVTYGSRATDSASDIKIEGYSPEEKGVQSLVVLAKDKYETRTYVDVEVTDGRMTFSLTTHGQKKTHVMFLKIVKGFQTFETEFDGTSLVQAAKWDGSQISGWRRRPRGGSWSEMTVGYVMSSSSYYNADSNNRMYGMWGANMVDRVERTFKMPEHTVVRIQLRYLAADSWDGSEHAYIDVDGESVWKTSELHPGQYCDGGFATMNAYNLYNPWAGYNRYSGYSDKCFFDVDLTILHKKQKLTLAIGSTIDGSRGDESWGFDDLVVSYHAAPETFASKPAINFNYGSPISTVMSFVDDNELTFQGDVVGTMDKLGGGFGITTKSGENAGQVISTSKASVTMTEKGHFWKSTDGGAMNYVVPMLAGDKVGIEAICAEAEESHAGAAADGGSSPGGDINKIFKSPTTYGYDFFDYDNFDDPTGEGRYDLWSTRNGGYPSIKCDDPAAPAFHGPCCQEQVSSWGTNWEWGTNREPASSLSGQRSDRMTMTDFPYLCMAYRVPIGSRANFLIRTQYGWRSLPLSAYTNGYAKLGDFNRGLYDTGLQPDGEWHYDCIDWKSQFDGFIGNTATKWVYGMIWYWGGTGKFWIDQLVISKTPVPPKMYMKALLAPTPFLRMKVDGVKPVITYTYGLDKNDDSAVVLTQNQGGGRPANIPELQYTRYDTLCWMQGIVEQIGEDRWNQWTIRWLTTHECSWQRTPGANRRIHPIMMANGVPMRWDTYGHYLYGIKDSGAYETKWGSTSGMNWRTSLASGDANAPYVDFLNGANHFDSSYLRPSQYKVPDDTLCVVEGMMRIVVANAKDVNKPQFNLKEWCRPDRPILFNLNNHENSPGFTVMPNGDVVFSGDGRIVHTFLSLQGITFDTVPGFPILDFGRYFSSTTYRAESMYPGRAPKGEWEVTTEGESASQRTKVLGDLAQWYEEYPEVSDALACSEKCGSTSDCGSFTFGATKKCRVSTCAARGRKWDLSGGSGGTAGQTRYTAQDGTIVNTFCGTYSSGNNFHISGLFDNSFVDGTTSQLGQRVWPTSALNCRSTTYHTCYWLAACGNGDITITFPEEREVGEIVIHPYGRPDGRNNFIVYYKDGSGNWVDVSGGEVDVLSYGIGDSWSSKSVTSGARLPVRAKEWKIWTRKLSSYNVLDEISFYRPASVDGCEERKVNGLISSPLIGQHVLPPSCVFPYKYQGTSYDGCTVIDNQQGRSAFGCSHTAVYANGALGDTWSQCVYDYYDESGNDVKGEIHTFLDSETRSEASGLRIQKLRVNVKCKSKDIDLARPAGQNVESLSACTRLCANNGRCNYFTYGVADKKCVAEVTDDASCSEGFEAAANTDFYELISADSASQWRPPSYKVHGNKICVVTGRVYSVDEDTKWDEETVLTLPPLCRPSMRLVFTVRAGNIATPSRVDVLPSGRVVWMKGESPWYSGGWLQLDGISFGTAAAGNILPIPRSGWNNYMRVKDQFSNYRAIKTKVDDGAAPFIVTGPDERESGVDTSKATQAMQAGKAAVLVTSEDVVPNNIAGLDTMELRDGVELPTTWTLDTYIKLPLARSNDRSGYRALFAGVGAPGADMGNYHAVVKMKATSAEIGVYTSGFGASSDPAGNPCVSGTFYPSGLDMEDKSIFAQRDGVFLNQWYRLTIVGTNGEERFYVDGALRGVSKCQLTSELSFVGNFIPSDFNSKPIKGGGEQPWGIFALARIYSEALLRETVNMLVAFGPTSACDLGCEKTPCAELTISKSCSVASSSDSESSDSQESQQSGSTDELSMDDAAEGSINAEGCIWSDNQVSVRSEEAGELWVLHESFHVMGKTQIDLRSLLNQIVSPTANVVWDVDTPAGSKHSTSFFISIAVGSALNLIGVKELSVAEGFKYRVSADIKFKQDDICAKTATFGWKIGSNAVAGWGENNPMKKHTWYSMVHEWVSSFSGTESVELLMEGCQAGAMLNVASFDVRQWTTSITVEKLLVQEGVATRSSDIPRSIFTTAGDQSGETNIAIVRSPVPTYLKATMSQTTIMDNQRNIAGDIVQKDTRFCEHSEWILPTPGMAFTGPAYSGATIIVSTTETMSSVRFRVYDDNTVDEDEKPLVSSYEDEDYYVEPGKMFTFKLDNPLARVIAIYADGPIIVVSSQLKPGAGHEYEYTLQNGDKKKISYTMDNGAVVTQKDEFCGSKMEAFRPPKDYALKILLPKIRMKGLLDDMRKRQVSGLNLFIDTPVLVGGQVVPVYNIDPNFANEQFTTLEFSKAKGLEELEDLRLEGVWTTEREILEKELKNKVIILLNMQGGDSINPPEWKADKQDNTGGSMKLAWWYEDEQFDTSKVAMFHLIIDEWDKNNILCEEYEKEDRGCWKPIKSCYTTDSYDETGVIYRGSKTEDAKCVYDKYRGSEANNKDQGAGDERHWSMIVSRLTNQTDYRIQIMAVGHKDATAKDCIMENIGPAHCVVGPPGSYKYYETSRPSKPSQPLNVALVSSSEMGGSVQFTWNDPVDFGGGDLSHFYIYAFDNKTTPIASTIYYADSLIPNQGQIDNPMKTGRAVMLEGFTDYSVTVAAANMAEWCFGAGLSSESRQATTTYYRAPEQIPEAPGLFNPTGGSMEADWGGFYLQERVIEDPKDKDKTITVRMSSPLDSGGCPLTSYAVVGTYVSPTLLSTVPLHSWVDFRGPNNIVDRMHDQDASGIAVVGQSDSGTPTLKACGSVLPGVSNYGQFDKSTHVEVPIDMSNHGPQNTLGGAAAADEPSWYYTLVGKTESISISAWVKPTESTNAERVIASVGDVIKEKNTEHPIGWSAILKMRNSRPEFVMPTDKKGVSTSVVSGAALVINVWTHVVGVYSGGCATLYVNGDFSGEVCPQLKRGEESYRFHKVKSAIENEAKTLPIPSAKLYIGAAPGCDSKSAEGEGTLCPSMDWSGSRWVGYIADVRVYDAAIEEEELHDLQVSWYPDERLQYNHRSGVVTAVPIEDFEYATSPARLVGNLKPETTYQVGVRGHSFVPPGNKHLVLTAHDDSKFDITFNPGFDTNPTLNDEAKNPDRGVTISFFMKVTKNSNAIWTFQNFMVLVDEQGNTILKLGLESSTQMTVANSQGSPLKGSSSPVGTWKFDEWANVAIQMKHLNHHTASATTTIELYVNGYLVQSGELSSVPLYKWDLAEKPTGWKSKIGGIKFSNPIPYKRATISVDGIRVLRGEGVDRTLIRRLMRESPLQIAHKYIENNEAWDGFTLGWTCFSQLTFEDGPYSLDATELTENIKTKAAYVKSQTAQGSAAVITTISSKHARVDFSDRGVALLSPASILGTREPSPPSAPTTPVCVPRSNKHGCDIFEDMVIDWSHLSLDWGGISGREPTSTTKEDGTEGELVYPSISIWHMPAEGGGFLITSTSAAHIDIKNNAFQEVLGTEAVKSIFTVANSGTVGTYFKAENTEINVGGWTFKNDKCDAGIVVAAKGWQSRQRASYMLKHSGRVAYIKTPNNDNSCRITSLSATTLLRDRIYTLTVEVGGMDSSTGYHVEAYDETNNVVLGALASHESSNAPLGKPVRNDIPIVLNIDFDMRDFPESVGKGLAIRLMHDGQTDGVSHYHKVSLLVGPGMSAPIPTKTDETGSVVANLTALASESEKYKIVMQLSTAIGESTFSPIHEMGDDPIPIGPPDPPMFFTGKWKDNSPMYIVRQDTYRLSGDASQYAKITLQFKTMGAASGGTGGTIQDIGLIFEGENINCNLTSADGSKAYTVGGDNIWVGSSLRPVDLKSTATANFEVDQTQVEAGTQFELKVPIKKLYTIQLMSYNEAHMSKISKAIVFESPGNCPEVFEGEFCNEPVVCPASERSLLCTQILPVSLTMTGFTKETFNMKLYLSAQAKFLGVPIEDVSANRDPVWVDSGKATISFEVSCSKGELDRLKVRIASLKNPEQRPVVSKITFPGTKGTFDKTSFIKGYASYVNVAADKVNVEVVDKECDNCGANREVELTITVIAKNDEEAEIIRARTAALYGPQFPAVRSSVTLTGLKGGEMTVEKAQAVLAAQLGVSPASNVRIISVGTGDNPTIEFEVLNLAADKVDAMKIKIVAISTTEGLQNLNSTLITVGIKKYASEGSLTVAQPVVADVPSPISSLAASVNTELAKPTAVSSDITLTGLKAGDITKENAQIILAAQLGVSPASNVRIISVGTGDNPKIEFQVVNLDTDKVEAMKTNIESISSVEGKTKLQSTLTTVGIISTVGAIATPVPADVTKTGVKIINPDAIVTSADSAPTISQGPFEQLKQSISQSYVESNQPDPTAPKISSSITLTGLKDGEMTEEKAQAVLAAQLGVSPASNVRIISVGTGDNPKIEFEVLSVDKDKVAEMQAKITTISSDEGTQALQANLETQGIVTQLGKLTTPVAVQKEAMSEPEVAKPEVVFVPGAPAESDVVVMKSAADIDAKLLELSSKTKISSSITLTGLKSQDITREEAQAFLAEYLGVNRKNIQITSNWEGATPVVNKVQSEVTFAGLKDGEMTAEKAQAVLARQFGVSPASNVRIISVGTGDNPTVKFEVMGLKEVETAAMSANITSIGSATETARLQTYLSDVGITSSITSIAQPTTSVLIKVQSSVTLTGIGGTVTEAGTRRALAATLGVSVDSITIVSVGSPPNPKVEFTIDTDKIKIAEQITKLSTLSTTARETFSTRLSEFNTNSTGTLSSSMPAPVSSEVKELPPTIEFEISTTVGSGVTELKNKLSAVASSSTALKSALTAAGVDGTALGVVQPPDETKEIDTPMILMIAPPELVNGVRPTIKKCAIDNTRPMILRGMKGKAKDTVLECDQASRDQSNILSHKITITGGALTKLESRQKIAVYLNIPVSLVYVNEISEGNNPTVSYWVKSNSTLLDQVKITIAQSNNAGYTKVGEPEVLPQRAMLDISVKRMDIMSLTLKGSSVSQEGGGIVNVNIGSTVFIRDVTIIGGRTQNGNGGAINIESGANFSAEALTIKGSSTESGNGGALACSGTCTLRGGYNSFSNCSAVKGGGFAVTSGGVMKITNRPATSKTNEEYANFQLEKNTAQDGGGVYLEGGTSLIVLGTNARMEVGFNSADNGGGMYAVNALIEAKNGATLSITNNRAQYHGGGLFVYRSNIYSVTVQNNYAFINGGGFYFSDREIGQSFEAADSEIVMRDVICNGNYAGRNGGGIFILDPAGLSLFSSNIKTNIAKINGGGIAMVSLQSVTYVVLLKFRENSQISSNKAIYGEGGGLYFVGSAGGNIEKTQLDFGKVTFMSNLAPIGGGVSIMNLVVLFEAATNIEKNTAFLGGGLSVNNIEIRSKSAGSEKLGVFDNQAVANTITWDPPTSWIKNAPKVGSTNTNVGDPWIRGNKIDCMSSSSCSGRSISTMKFQGTEFITASRADGQDIVEGYNSNGDGGGRRRLGAEEEDWVKDLTDSNLKKLIVATLMGPAPGPMDDNAETSYRVKKDSFTSGITVLSTTYDEDSRSKKVVFSHPGLSHKTNFDKLGSDEFRADKAYGTGERNLTEFDYLPKALKEVMESMQSVENKAKIYECKGTCRSNLTITGKSDIEQSGFGGGVYFGSLDSTSNMVLSKLWIRGCNADSGGGGLYTSRSTGTLSDIVIESCASTMSGGGMMIDRASLSPTPFTIVNTNLRMNTAKISGGGLYVNDGARVLFRKSEFSENEAIVSGGALSIDLGSNVTLEESVLSKNVAFSKGGAVSMTRKTTLLMTSTTFTRNTVKGVTNSKNKFIPGSGGAVWLSGTGAVLRIKQNSLFYYNRAFQGYGGSIACENGAKLEVINTEFLGYKNFNATAADNQDMMPQLNSVTTVVSTGSQGGGESSSEVESTDTKGLALEGGGIFISGMQTSATFVELKFTNMNADQYGGCLALADGASVVANNIAVDTSSAETGGAFSVLDGSTFDMTFIKTVNVKAWYGACLYSHSSTVIMHNAAISVTNGNAISSWNMDFPGTDGTVNSDVGDLSGGALYLYKTNVTVAHDSRDAHFIPHVLCEDNQAAKGGCIFVDGSSTHNLRVHANRCKAGEVGGQDGSGAVFYIQHSTEVATNFQISHSNFRSNVASQSGGVVYINGHVTFHLESSLALGNEADVGGAMAVVGTVGKESTVSVVSTSFEENVAKRVDGDGGALVATNANIKIQSSNFLRNKVETTGRGGAISFAGFKNQREMTIEGTTFEENGARLGGALYLKDTRMGTNSDVVFKSNSAENGGAIYVETLDVDMIAGAVSSILSLDNMKLSLNKASKSGGSIFMRSANVTMANFEESESNAVDGGGFAYITDGSTMKASKGTIEDTYVNVAEGKGGVINIDKGSSLDMNQVAITSSKGYLAQTTGAKYCDSKDCYSALQGGALYVKSRSTKATLQDVTIKGFITEAEEGLGGGVYVEGSAEFTMSKSTISYCNATSGAGVYAGSDTIVLVQKESVIQHCRSMYEAAAVYIQLANVIVTDSTIQDNYCEGDGGAVYVDAGSDLFIDSSTFVRNKAARGGAVFVGRQSIFGASRTTFKSNEAAEDGGAIAGEDNYRQAFKLVSLVFDSNSATNGMGGAMHLNRASSSLSSCTFKKNIASTGGAVSLYGYVGGGSMDRTKKIRSKLILVGESNIFEENTASTSDRSGYARGGAVYVGGTSLYNSTAAELVQFTSNTAQAGGAVFITASAEGSFVNTKFESNSALRLSGGRSGSRSTTTLDGNGGAIYFEGDNWRSQSATGTEANEEDNIKTAFFGSGCSFSQNKAEDGCGGAMYFTYLRGQGSKNGKIFGADISFDGNVAKSGKGIFWQFRGEGAKEDQRTTKTELGAFHTDIKQFCKKKSESIKPGKDGFLATSAVSMKVKQGGFPRGGVSITTRTLGTYSSTENSFLAPSNYPLWFNGFEIIGNGAEKDVLKKNGGWSKNTDLKQKMKAYARIQSNGDFGTKSGHTVEDKVTGERTQLQAVDFYGNDALDRGTTYCSASSSDASVTVPSGSVRTGSVEEKDGTTKEGVISYQSLSMRGKIGSTSTVTLFCGNPLSDLVKGEMGSISFEVTIHPCDPGEELSGAQVCEWCKEKYYSLEGYKCLPCPEGGICKTRLGTSEPPTYRGTSRPAVVPGYWLYDAPKWLVERTDYCWDVSGECKEEKHCQHGLCQKMADGECKDGGNETWDPERIHHCITHEYFYRCPMDDVACRGTVVPVDTNNNTMEEYLPATPSCGENRDWYPDGPRNCTETCNEGYEGIKCKTCKENWFKTADHSCVPCVGDLDPEATKVIYGVGLVISLILMCVLIGIFLRDDSGSPLWRCLFLPCVACIRNCSRDAKARKIAKRASAVRPSSGGESADEMRSSSNDMQMVLRWEKLKIFLAWQQIFGQMKWNYNIPWPKEVATYMRLYAVFQLDLISLLPLDCLQRTDFYFGLVFSLLLPCICLVMIAILHGCGKCRYRGRLNKIPRKCVKTGKKIPGRWMSAAEAHKLANSLAKAGLNDVFGEGKVTKAMIKMEMAEANAPMLPYASSYANGITASSPSGLSGKDYTDVMNHNVKAFRKRVRKRIDHMQYVSKLWKMFFLLLLLAYPSVAMRVTRFFSCETIGNISYLSIDSRTLCKDEVWSSMLVIALISCVLYVVGTPLLFFALVSSSRNTGVKWKLQQCSMLPQLEKRLLMEAKTDANYSFEFWDDPEQGETDQIRKKMRRKAIVTYLQRLNMRSHTNMDKFGFIYESYSEKVWWYEVVELFRKFSLNAMIVLLAPNEDAQAVIGCAIAVFFLVFVQTIRPYTNSTDNLLAFVAHLQLVLTLLCGILIQHDNPMIGVSTEPEPAKRLALSNLILSIVVIASHAAVFLFFFFSLIQEMFFSQESQNRLKRAKLRENAIKASTRAKQKIKNLKKKMHGGMIKMMTKSNMLPMKESWGDDSFSSKSDGGQDAMLQMATTEEWL